VKNRDLKRFLETLIAVATIVAPAAGWLHSKLETHDRQLALLNFKVFGITYVEPATMRLLGPEQGRADRMRLAEPFVFSFLKPKESKNENP
jgi:hypothetical protein